MQDRPGGSDGGWGTVFRISTSGDFQSLHKFCFGGPCGSGATKPPLPAGKLVTTAAPLANTVRLTVGGIVAKVAFAGLSGSGLDQLNVTIPPGLADGDAAVVATVGVSTTQTNLFITVQH